MAVCTAATYTAEHTSFPISRASSSPRQEGSSEDSPTSDSDTDVALNFTNRGGRASPTQTHFATVGTTAVAAVAALYFTKTGSVLHQHSSRVPQRQRYCSSSCCFAIPTLPIRAQWARTDLSKPTRRHPACTYIRIGLPRQTHHKNADNQRFESWIGSFLSDIWLPFFRSLPTPLRRICHLRAYFLRRSVQTHVVHRPSTFASCSCPSSSGWTVAL